MKRCSVPERNPHIFSLSHFPEFIQSFPPRDLSVISFVPMYFFSHEIKFS